MLKLIYAILKIEFLLYLRRSTEWLYPILFFLIVLSLFPIAFSADPIFLKKFAPCSIWVAALLSSLLSVQTIFLSEMEDGYLEQLFLSAYPTLSISLKLFAHWLVTQAPLIIIMPFICFIFNIPYKTTDVLMISLLLGSPILSLIGVLSVSLSLGLRQQGVMLSVLFLPLVLPVVILSVTLIQEIQAGLSCKALLFFLSGLSLFTITVLPWIISYTLKLSFDE